MKQVGLSNHPEFVNSGPERQTSRFLLFVFVSSKFSDMHDSFGIHIEVRNYIMGMHFEEGSKHAMV